MDGDIFGRVTKLGRAAAEAVWRALSGGPWDAFCAAKCLDTLIEAAGGLPSLASIRFELASLREAPLLARLGVEGALRRIRDATHQPRTTELDLMLGSVATREILRGVVDGRAVLVRFCGELLDRAIISGSGGLLTDHGHDSRDRARAILAPVAESAAAVLDVRPTAVRLGLANAFRIDAETNLLEGE